jgi:predicted nucleotidyltransferase
MNFITKTEDVWPILNNEEYGFLKEIDETHPLLFITLCGSRGYGTNLNDAADYDFRGMMCPSEREFFGFSKFEQYEIQDKSRDVDTTIYTTNKLISLLTKCNPNVIEMLGCNDYIIFHNIAKELIDNRKMFLSRRAIASFSGFATEQFNRFENNLARYVLTQEQKERHILNSVTSCMASLNDRYASLEDQNLKLYIDKSQKRELETEIFLDLDFKHYPLRDFSKIIEEFSNIVNAYNKVNHKNERKDDAALNKHAMHLIRAYYMLYDILTKEEIITYRKDEQNILLNIRRGCYQSSDGNYKDEFFDLLNDVKKRCAYAEKNTSLPEEPDAKEIEDFTIHINREALRICEQRHYEGKN